MLKTKVEHFFGSQERHDLQMVKLSLDIDNLVEREALENGWLIANEQWYQCRSVRINIEEYTDKSKEPKMPKTLTFEFFWRSQIDDDNRDHIKTVFKQFCEYKGFDDQAFDVFKDWDRSAWIIVYDEGVPVAFTKFIRYDSDVESQFTAWNYHKPKLSIGKALIWYETIIATEFMGSDKYLYIGQGYEEGSAYKADIPGFEWWTGSEWSKDREEYKALCARDSSINSLQELSKVYNNGDR
jgi:hypothetical protein